MTSSDYMDRVLDLVEGDALKPCEVCGGLPPGLPPQCYDKTVQCCCAALQEHAPSVVMGDREGRFQRCRTCGARRKVAALGVGPWDKGPECGSEESAEIPLTDNLERTQQERLDELF